jgi:predicted transcriptional regulator
MEHTNQTSKGPSVTTILRNISDDKALVLFNSIAMSSGNYKYLPIKEMNLSTKQYYTRVSRLLGAGLIKRDKGRYYLTLLGKIVYESQKTIGITLSYYWKLKAIESLEGLASGIPAGEIAQLITALIDNHQIKDIIMKPIYAPSIKCDSKVLTSTPVMTQTIST